MLDKLYCRFDELLSQNLTVDEIKRNDPNVQKSIRKMKIGSNIFIWPAAQMGNFVFNKLLEKGYSNVHLIDKDYEKITFAEAQSPNSIHFGEDDVLIIATLRHSFEIFSAALEMNCNNIMMYYHLELLEENSSIDFPVDFYAEVFTDLTKHLLENVDAYKNMYELLEDDPSRVAFLNNMLFRLTYDITYTFEYDHLCNQYFDSSLIQISDNTVFVDGGAYNGDTLQDFLKISNNKYKSYYLFEPDLDLLKEAQKVSNDQRIHFMNKGLYSKTCELNFNKTCGENGSIDEQGTDIISVASIDEAINEPVTYIKMDIEGAELAALKGAEDTIKNYSPILAICMYHKASDYLDIFNYIRSVNSEYKFYLRHHLNYYAETVLYAIKK